MSFSRWLRANSEHYLIIASQNRIAKRHDVMGPVRHGGLKDLLWLGIFVPLYRAIPWPLRYRIMRSMPGSHRKDWHYEQPPTGPAI